MHVQPDRDSMTGAESLLATLLACGVETCFANPGTSELHLVSALESEPRIRSVLCLFEGVATGAADGYGRMKGKPAVSLLHLGSGFANGWANLHNARKAKTPVVNLVGQHSTSHLPLGGAQVSDLEGVSGSISDWLKASDTASEVGADAARAIRAAVSRGGQVATLIVPGDASWETGGIPGRPLAPEPANQAAGDNIEEAARILTSGRRAAVLTTGPSLAGEGREACTRIAAATGAAFFCPSLYPRMERGAGRMAFRRVPAWGRSALEILGEFDDLVVVGTELPILAFGHPEYGSVLVPDKVRTFRLAGPEDDVAGTMAALADRVGAGVGASLCERASPTLAEGPLTAEAIGRAICRFLPEGAVVSDESGTGGAAAYPLAAGAAPHDSLYLTGGAIGQALPVALGAAIACPDRKVLCLQADGGGMYTLQSLWSMARERCDVTTVIFSNRVYGILVRSLGQYGIGTNRIPDLFDLSNPELDWARLAEGMGVEGHVCNTAEDFNRVFEDCIGRKGPQLIEAVI